MLQLCRRCGDRARGGLRGDLGGFDRSCVRSACAGGGGPGAQHPAARRPLPGADAARNLLARAAGGAQRVPAAGRALPGPRRRPAAAGGAHRGRLLAGIAGLALRADPAGRAGAVFLRADREQGHRGRGGGCHRSGGRRGRATDGAAARLCPDQRGRARGRRADDRRVARHRVRMRDRTRRTDGGVRSRVHHRVALRRRGASLSARAHP